FEGSVASIFGQIVSREPTAPSKICPELSPEFDALCLKALAKSPSQRHASAASFADDLSRLLFNVGELSPTMTFRPDLKSESPSTPDNDSVSASRSRRD